MPHASCVAESGSNALSILGTLGLKYLVTGDRIPVPQHMYLLFGLLILIFLILGAISLFQSQSVSENVQNLPYKLRPSVFNRSETAFFIELKKQLPEGFNIFPKIRIIDFIDPNSREYKWRNKIWAKHIDFLICDSNFKPVLAIELNGKSHQRKDRVERDEFIKQIFIGAKLPLEFVNVGSNFENSVTRIKTYL